MAIAHLEIHDGDRIGLVGPNGIGKSTLLHGLLGDVPFDEGQVLRRASIAMITQEADVCGSISPYWAKRLRLGETTESGGERMRQAIAAAMSQEAALLLADEPTTNLDVDGIELVEQLLRDYPGAVVVVSHDRRLLDNVCTTIWALEKGGALRVFPGNYSAYVARLNAERKEALLAYQQYQAEKARLTEAARRVRQEAQRMTNTSRLLAKGYNSREISRGKPFFEASAGRKVKRAKAIERRIAQLAVKERPQALPEVHMSLGAAAPITARKALTVKELTVRYGQRVILSDVSFNLPTGSRTAVMGPNGCGKSTLVKALMSDNPAVEKARGLKIGYFAQNHEQLDAGKTVLANARAHSQLSEREVRTILARLRLFAHDLTKTPAELSGGQRAKLALAQLLAGDYNLLILDEPTNHLDGFAAGELEKLLQAWNGTLLVVTHDRQLADQVASRLLIIADGQVTAFAGSWSDYRRAQESPQRQSEEVRLDQLAFDLRKAELAGKIALARQKNHDASELEEAWQKLMLAKPQYMKESE